MYAVRYLFVGMLCGVIGGLFISQQHPDLIQDAQSSIDTLFDTEIQGEYEESVYGVQSVDGDIPSADSDTAVIDYTDSICGTISHRRNIDMHTPTVTLNNDGLRQSTYMCTIAQNGKIVDSFPSRGGVGIYPPKTYNYRKSQDSRDFNFEEIELGMKEADGNITRVNIPHSCDVSDDFDIYIGCMQDTLDTYSLESTYTLHPNTKLGGGIDKDGNYFLYIYMYDLMDVDTNTLVVLTDAQSSFEGIYKAGFAEQAFDHATCRYTTPCQEELIKTKRVVEAFAYDDLSGLEILDTQDMKTIDYLNEVDMNGIYTNNHRNICTSELSCCGDGVVDEGEECDTGINDDDSDGCSDECVIIVPSEEVLEAGQDGIIIIEDIVQ